MKMFDKNASEPMNKCKHTKEEKKFKWTVEKGENIYMNKYS